MADAAQVQRQARVHALRMLREPLRQLAGDQPQQRQVARGCAGGAFSHHLQHHLVLHGVAVAVGVAGLAHPAVFLAEVLDRVGHQHLPARQQFVVGCGLHRGEQVDEFTVRVVHLRQLELQRLGPFEGGHVHAGRLGGGRRGGLETGQHAPGWRDAQ
jgi:hypothetical protein